jgi:hypothetical protein
VNLKKFDCTGLPFHSRNIANALLQVVLRDERRRLAEWGSTKWATLWGVTDG